MRGVSPPLMVAEVVIWPTGPVSLTWTDSLNNDLTITGAHGFCFHGSEVVLCDIVGRGLSVPGGHLENSEDPEQCLRREAAEEAGIELGRVKLLGFLIADHSVNSTYSARYPVIAAQAILWAEVSALLPYDGHFESRRRVLVPASELATYHRGWCAPLEAAYAAARACNPAAI